MYKISRLTGRAARTCLFLGGWKIEAEAKTSRLGLPRTVPDESHPSRFVAREIRTIASTRVRAYELVSFLDEIDARRNRH